MVSKIGNSRSYIYLVCAMTLGYTVIRSSVYVVFRIYTTCAMFAVADRVGWEGWGGLYTAYTSNETVAAVYGRNDDDDDNDNNSYNNNSKK